MSPTWCSRAPCAANRSWRYAPPLGAIKAVLRRALLAESLVLCGSGVLGALILALPMVAILGRHAARFSVRAEGLTLDFSLVWIGIELALIASIFLAYIPRLPCADPLQGFGLTADHWGRARPGR